MCDSLIYIESDSAFDFFGEPVLWSEENQLTASQIRVVMENQQLAQNGSHGRGPCDQPERFD